MAVLVLNVFVCLGQALNNKTPLFLKTSLSIISLIQLGARIIMIKKGIIRQLIVAKKLLKKSEELIDSDSIENNLVVISNLDFKHLFGNIKHPTKDQNN